MRVYSVRFPSPITSGIAPNDSIAIQATVPQHASGRVPVVVLLHYWGATDSRVELSMARELARHGMGAVIMPLPYHLSRTPVGVRSGALAVSSDPQRLVSTMAQSVLDLKRVADWIGTRPEYRHDRIGISGTSLGAIVASLAVGVEPRFTDAAFVVGGVDLAYLLWHSSRVVLERDSMRSKGFTEGSLRELLAPIEPMTYLKQHGPKNSYVIGALYDTVIPPASVQRLIDSLESPSTLWLDIGHYGGFLIQKRIQSTTADFFVKAFADQPFIAPKGLRAPTIRLGVSIDTRTGFQISAGVDLYRPNWRGDPFAAIMVQPASTQLVFGINLEKGLAAGVFVRSSGVGFGIMWSMIL